MRMKFTQKMRQSITFQATSSACSWLLVEFPLEFPAKQDRKSEQLDERSSITSAHKGVVEGGGWAKARPQNGGRPRWSPETRLQGRAGSL